MYKTLNLSMLLLFSAQAIVVQAQEYKDPMQPPAFALQKYRQAQNKNKSVKPVSTVKKPQPKPLQLRSILFSSVRKIAIIDDQLLKVGDVIRGAKLIKINKHGVRLLRKGKVINLSLTREFTAIKKSAVESKL